MHTYVYLHFQTYYKVLKIFEIFPLIFEYILELFKIKFRNIISNVIRILQYYIIYIDYNFWNKIKYILKCLKIILQLITKHP